MKRLATIALITAAMGFVAPAPEDAQAQAPAMFTGTWRIQHQIDPIDDHAENWLVIGNQREYLAVGCAPGDGLQVVFQAPDFVGRDHTGFGREAAYRFGHAPAVSSLWRYDDQRVTSADVPQAETFARQLRGSNNLFIRLEKYDASYLNYRFNYPIPDAELDRIIALCALPEKPAPARTH